jgi:hypothetical protein
LQRKAETRDVERAGRRVEPHERNAAWWVCEDYRIRRGWIVATHPFHLQPTGTEETGSFLQRSAENRSHWRVYRPLDDAPELCLELASLHEADDFDEAALRFVRRYGAPGGAETRRQGQEDRVTRFFFRQQVERLWFVLRLYEAALNRDGENAGRLLVEYAPQFLELSGELYPPSLRHYPHDLDRERVAQAIEGVTSVLEESVHALCRPEFVEAPGYDADDVSSLRRGWSFKNLWGAAYLQMYWLVTSAEELVRCEACRRIMSLARARPDGRKTRRDKRFCSNSCRQARYRSRN